MEWSKPKLPDESGGPAKPVSGLNETKVYAQRYERIGDPPALWTWFKNGTIYRNDEYIRSSSFYNSDTFAEIICDRSGPEATEYPPRKQFCEQTYKNGYTKRWWAFDQVNLIADYVEAKRVLVDAQPIVSVLERLRKNNLIERRIR